MKAVWLFCAIISLTYGAPASQSLADDFEDILKLLPFDDIKAITDKHLAHDGALAGVVAYLQGPEWAKLVRTTGSKPAVQELIVYLTEAGLQVQEILNWLRELIVNAVPGVEPEGRPSLEPLFDDIDAIIPEDKLNALVEDKMEHSPYFQEFYKKISSEKAHALVEEIRTIDEVLHIAQKLTEMGVKVDEALDDTYDFLGWDQPKPAANKLMEDLMDIAKVLPLEDIKTIVEKHLANDGAFAAVITYLQGPEWAKLVRTARSRKEVKNLIVFLTEAGLPVEEIANWWKEQIEDAIPGVTPDEKASLVSLLNEIEAIIPVDDLIAVLNNKMQNSVEFQNFYRKLSSEEAHDLVEDVRGVVEVRHISQKLMDMGVEIDKIEDMIFEYFGWGEPKRY